MLNTHLKLVWRSLLKNKTISLINILGLTIGLATAILIGLYVLTEWQTDRGLPLPDRTYRLLRVSGIAGEAYDIGVTSVPYAPALTEDFPDDIAEVVRVLSGSSLVQHGEERFEEDRYYYVDANFFTFFGLPLLYGDAETALGRPHTVVLTLETAERYFGDASAAMGQTLRVDNDYDVEVTGVLAGSMAPSHLRFDFVESLSSYQHRPWWTDWWNNGLCTYLRLTPASDASALEARFPGFMDTYFGDDFAVSGTRIDLRLQPLRSVYFEADTRFDPMRHGSRQAVQIFSLAVLLLIAVACFNYVNLTTARSVERRVEVGISQAMGSGRARIVLQMLGESLLVTLVSVLAAVVLAKAALPWFEQAFDIRLNPVLSLWQIIASLAGTTLVISILAGLYPGWLMASYTPIQALKGGRGVGEGSMPVLRQSLVVFQFLLSIGLLCSTLIIHRQLAYLREVSLGFDREHVVLFQMNNPEIRAQRSLVEERLAGVPGVRSVSFSSGHPGGFHDASTVHVTGIDQPVRMNTAFVDFGYLETYGMEIVAGRGFSREMATDSTRSVLLNERAVAELRLSMDEAMGRQTTIVYFDSIPRTVVGIVSDFHFASLHDPVEPLVISTDFTGRAVGVKVEAGQTSEVIAAMEGIWADFAPSYPFDYAFLDEHLDRLYASEQRQGRLFNVFAAVALLIACLGVFGLAAFSTIVRKKEIGIRKVLGASIPDIVTTLSRSFVIQVVLAAICAVPITYLGMRQWLEGFAYRIDIGVSAFVLAGVVAVAVALATVGYHALRAALADPVKSLRYE
jgi:putative ABC transport system permease protein